MDVYLKSQLHNAKEIKEVLKQVPYTHTLTDGRQLETLLVYLPIESKRSNHKIFFEKIKEGILANFALSCKEVETKLGINSITAPEELFNKAVRRFSQHTAKGELGELILFTLLDVFFGAPKLLTKVKTNRRMPVHGADAVHGQFRNGKFRLYLGESKVHKAFNAAANKAVTSIVKVMDEYETEFDLLDSNIDFPGIDEDSRSEIISLLNPFSKIDLTNVIHSPCFIGFTADEVMFNANTESEFVQNYIASAREQITYYFSKAESKGIEINNTALFILPFSCIDELVKDFIEYMDIKK